MELKSVEYSRLPEKYLVPIKENLPPLPGPGVYGRPFWTASESRDLIYKDGLIRKLFSYCKPDQNFLTYEYEESVEIGDKGFICIGCEPGSGPQPFIVVNVNHESSEIGYISPYVYITNETDDVVELRVGGDTNELNRYDSDHIDEFFETIKNPSDKYVVHYCKIANKPCYLSYCVGSFGNYGLPYPSKGQFEYEFLD